MASLPRKNYARIPVKLDLPNLTDIQLDSFERLKKEGLGDLFHEVSPIESYNKGMKLFFPSRSPEARQWGMKYWFGEPKHSIEECVERDLTYANPLYVSVLLAGADVPEPIKQDIFLGDFPELTDKGTFIINGTERVVVSQLIRSPGVYFEAPTDRATGRPLAMAKLIPDRGAWMEFETRKSDYIILKFNRKRTVPITVFLRALSTVDDGDDSGEKLLTSGTDEELINLFQDVDTHPERLFIASTLQQEPEWDLSGGISIAEAALIEFFRKMRPGDPATLDNARSFLEEQLFDQRHYDLERVGRYKLNQKLDLQIPIPHRTVTKNDVIRLIRRMIQINNGTEPPDDIDHLGNRRVKTVGELIQNKLRIGLRRMERVIKERMSIRDQEQLSPVTLVNIRPVVAALREFFGSSQLSQFMDQTNPLAELRHKRTLSALGPGGLRRERAGFDVRDVHHSHYGRICPIETPEGPNIGLIGRLATYGRVNQYGFIETPYRRVIKSLPNQSEILLGQTLRADVTHPDTGEQIAAAGADIDEALAKKIAALPLVDISIVPFVSDDMEYMSADVEDRYIIGQANAPLDEKKRFQDKRISSRYGEKFVFEAPERLDFMDIAPRQIVGISAALIPFLEHDDANRALMGSNMQAQAVPLLLPEIPLVATGMEWQAAVDSGQVVTAEEDGEITSVTGRMVELQTKKGKKNYKLRKFNRSNQSTCIDQRPIVRKGQRVKKGDVLADSSSTSEGQLALGQNVLCAFISWEGGNYEDAILISERLVRDDKFTSIHIEKHEVEARDTKLGPEEITHDIPNVGEEALKDLDEEGIIRIGAEVGPNDILVGKITPKGEKELSPEEKLLRAIFGEKAREVKDSSLRLPHGEHGKVVDVKIFTRDEYRDLPAGVDKMVRVSGAQKSKLTEGDKMAGRHGNKGVISRVVPIEDMPFLADGTPVDIILNPLGVPGRMNIGQILETHLGWASDRLGFRAITPVFDGADEVEIEAELARAWMIDQAWRDYTKRAWDWLREQSTEEQEEFEDDDEVRSLYLASLLDGSDYDLDLLATDQVLARRVVLREWLRENDFDPDQILVFENDGRAHEVLKQINKNAVDACLRLWLLEHGEDAMKAPADEIKTRAHQLSLQLREPL